MLAATEIDQWARTEAVPSQEEISRIRQLITRIENGLDHLTDAEREQISQAVAIVRRHRTVTLGMPRLRQALPDIRPERYRMTTPASTRTPALRGRQADSARRRARVLRPSATATAAGQEISPSSIARAAASTAPSSTVTAT